MPRASRSRIAIPAPRLILASASPRRQALLREGGYDFLTHPAAVDEENTPPGLGGAALALHLADAKAAAVAEVFPDDVVLGADTVIHANSRDIGKPRDADDARRLLRSLAGADHLVFTAVAVRRRSAGLALRAVASSEARVRALTEEELSCYLASGAWRGKAGGYGIQDSARDQGLTGGEPVAALVSGSHGNVVGLPMEETRLLLAGAGIFPALAPRAPGSGE